MLGGVSLVEGFVSKRGRRVSPAKEILFPFFLGGSVFLLSRIGDEGMEWRNWGGKKVLDDPTHWLDKGSELLSEERLADGWESRGDEHHEQPFSNSSIKIDSSTFL